MNLVAAETFCSSERGFSNRLRFSPHGMKNSAQRVIAERYAESQGETDNDEKYECRNHRVQAPTFLVMQDQATPDALIGQKPRTADLLVMFLRHRLWTAHQSNA